MPAFDGKLNPNEIYGSLFNALISIETFVDNIYDTKASLVDRARVDGSMYGDTKLYVFTDVSRTYPWAKDTNGKTNRAGLQAEANNLLELAYPEDPKTDKITLDVFRQIRMTTDDYLSKRAWGTAEAYEQFKSVVLGWIRDTKRVYDSTTYNTFIGSHVASNAPQNRIITLQAEVAGEDASNTEARNRLDAQTIAMEMANLVVDVEDVSRDFNEFGQLRSFSIEDFVVVWNASWSNKITHLDLPTIFNMDKAKADKFAEYTLPARYFGNINDTAGTAPTTNLTIRSLVEGDYGDKHVFPGDLIPGGAEYAANDTYTVDSNILFKLYHKRAVPYMSGFQVQTEFVNPRSLTSTKYLTFAHNTLHALEGLPFITVKAVRAEA